MPSRKAVRAEDKRLRTPGQKDKFDGKGPRTRMELYLDGQLKVEDMTDKELKKGRWADKNGQFKGRPPKMMPKKFFDELQRETIRRWERDLVKDLNPAIEALREIARGDHRSKTPADARFKASVYLIERVVGKVPEKSEVKLEVAKWEEDIEGVLYEPEGDE